ncbi:hypothetical protein [Actinomadura meridiana]
MKLATHALTAYEQQAFPGQPPLLQRDTLYTEALLAALVCDLEHYAAYHGINFSAVLGNGREINAQETAEDAPFKVGDQVRLTRQSDLCGTIVAWQNTASDTETIFIVEVPGLSYLHAETAANLTPAPPFPPTNTSFGPITDASQAEQTYISIMAQLPKALVPTRRALEQDRELLLSTLSSWSGVPETRIQDELHPMRRSAPYQESASREAKAASADFPAPITREAPTPRNEPGRTKQPPSSSGGPINSP